MRTEQLNKCFEPLQKMRVRLCASKTSLSLPIILYITNRSKAILLLWFYFVFWSRSFLLFKPYFVFWSRSFLLFKPYICFHILVKFG